MIYSIIIVPLKHHYYIWSLVYGRSLSQHLVEAFQPRFEDLLQVNSCDLARKLSTTRRFNGGCNGMFFMRFSGIIILDG